ncbi:glycosyltransferase [Fictibacillus iocasae]|uniref:Glycosyltransferase n=1 Tax=Fictibacillus iocasae TaxID=2715437 RepID=A0ABW2NNF6_9BACL
MNKKINILFLTPYYSQSRGNSTTARRIEAGLSKAGCVVKVFAYDEEAWNEKVKKLIDEADILHILHFGRFLEWQQMYGEVLTKPYVVTSGGTDVNHSLQVEDVDKYKVFLRDALAVSVFSEDGKQALLRVLPELEKKIAVIPQGVYLPDGDDGEERLQLPPGSPKFLLPAGLRAVKDIFFAIRPLMKLKNEYHGLTLLIIGAKLDEDIYQRLTLLQEKLPWVHYHNEVDLSQMKQVYDWSDIVINTSLSEGQPTSLLEAMYFHKPVLARNNGGNRSLISHRENGFIFCDAEDFYHFAKLLLSSSIKEQIVQKGADYCLQHHPIEKEIAAYLEIYQKRRI